jgi:hypothetical protein
VSEHIDPAKAIAVIRSASERTRDGCRALLVRQLPEGAVHVLDERPFEAALRACYRIGIESDVEWMVTVDADVLPRPGAVWDLLAVAESLSDDYLQVEGLVHDKLLGGYRSAGHRAYRTRHLRKALDALPPDGTQIRPETWALERLAREGHPSTRCEVVFGVHDHEQFYRDIYRKSFVQGQKFREWLPEVVPRWRALADEDPDFRVAMRGFFDGFESPELAPLDVGRYSDRAEDALRRLGIAEKSDLPRDAVEGKSGPDLPSRVLAAQPHRRPATRYDRIKSAYGRLGVVRMVPLALGSTLCLAGNGLRRMAGARRHRDLP